MWDSPKTRHIHVAQGGPLGPIFFLLRTALKEPHYGIFSRSPARAIFEPLFGDLQERKGYVALPPTCGPGNFIFLGMKLALHVASCKVQLPIKDMDHSPHTSGSLSPNNFIGIT